MKKLLIGCALAMSAGLLGAAEVAYTAGAEDKNNLADAANWGGTLPTVDDIGVIDCSQFGYSFIAKADVAFKGLCFENNGKVIYIEDDGKSTISVGSEGVTLARGNGFVPKGRWALTAPQVWTMAIGVMDSRATYSGTVEWTISNYQAVAWTQSPRYGGKIVGKSASAGNSAYAMSFKKGELVAAEVRVEGSAVFELPQRVKMSSLFSGRTFAKTGWSDVTFTGPGTLVVEEGDTFEVSAANLLQIPRGYLEIAGGTVKGGAAVELGSMGGTQGIDYQGSLGGIVVSDGTFTMNQMHVGANSTTNRTVVQDGGTVEACTYHVGGHQNDRRASASLEEYVLADGLIKDKTGAAHDRGLVLASGVNSAENGYSYPGVFTQTGGESTFDRVYWGAQGGFWTWDDWNTVPNGRGYGLLDLKGGTFALPPNGLNLGRMWNAGDVKESAYDIKLRGATVAGGRNKDIGFEMTVAASETPTVWNTQSQSDRLTAPVDGVGTLRKTGSGALMLTDATRFRGSLEVAEGVLDVQGVPQEPAGFTVGTDCLILTGDKLAETVEDGASVSTWSDTTGAVTARPMATGDVAKPETYGVPTLETGVFNGHAGVKFSAGSKQALAFPKTGNPLCGETNFTVALVFKPTENGQGSRGSGNSYAGRTLIGNTRNWRNQPNCLAVTYDGDQKIYSEARYHIGTTSKAFPNLYSPTKAAVNGVSVVFVSMEGEKLMLNLNGNMTNIVADAARGLTCPRFTNTADGTRYPLYIGTSDVDNTDAQSARCFYGYIAEIRIYRGRALTLPEQRSLCVALTRKYVGAADADSLERTADGPMAAALGDSRVAPATKAPDVEWTAEFCHQNLDTWGAEYTKPELVPNAWANGGSALRFDAAKQTVLKVTDDPLKGLKTFTLAFVFRTTTDGTGGSLVKEHVGFYSSMLKDFGTGHSYDENNSGCGNAAVTFVEGGGVSAFHGTNHDNGSVINPRKPCRLDDGQPHVVVYSGDGGDADPARHGTFRLMVDGVLTEGTYGYGTTWPGYDSTRPHVIGALRAGVGHFTGDISGFQFWKSQLSAEEMRTISEKAALEYGFNLKAKAMFAASDLTARGLGATNVAVAAGATLRMPLSASAPYVVTSETTLSGAGAFEGSYRFAEGSVADFGGVAAKMEDVQIASGAVMKFGETAVCPVAGGNVSAISGAVVVDITGSPAAQCVKSRYPLLEIAPERIAEGTTFTLVGGRSGMSVEYNEKAGGLAVVQEVGLWLLVR